MLKVGSQYIEEQIYPVIEKRWKLFEDIAEANGDIVYDFAIIRSSTNDNILKISSFVDRTDKNIYNLPATIETEAGEQILVGFVNVIDWDGNVINATFISGNSTWIGDISGTVSELDLWSYGEPASSTSDNTEGVIYVPVNKGTLGMKIWPQFHGADSMPTAYIKTIFNKIFSDIGIKLTGDLLRDWNYQHLTVGTNSTGGSSVALINRESKAGMSSSQATSAIPVVVEFNDVTNFPNFDGIEGNFNVSTFRYVADRPMGVDIELELELSSSDLWILEVRRNGSADLTKSETSDLINVVFSKYQPTSSPYMTLNSPGDYIDITLSTNSPGTITGGYIHVIPKKFVLQYPQFLFGDMSKRQFVSNIFKIFNVVPVYDNITGVLECKLFKNIKASDPVDLSQELSMIKKIDTTTIIENYGATTFLKYKQDENEEVDLYNSRVQKKYGDGEINISNSLIGSESEIEVDFTSSISQYAEPFGAYFPKIDLYSMAEGTEIQYTSVSDDGSGFAQFNTSGDHGFDTGDFVRIKTSSTGSYLGIGVVRSVPSSTAFTLQITGYVGTSGGVAVSVDTSETEQETLFAFLVMASGPISTFTNTPTYYAGVTPITSLAYGWFMKPSTGLPIDDYKHQLGFEPPNPKAFKGLFLKDQYYREVELMLNDPVMVVGEFYLSNVVYNRLNSGVPVRIKTKEINSLFYINRITGFANSYTPCEIELIKLS